MDPITYGLAGILAAWVVMWVFVVRPLVNDIRQMRYSGFKADLPMPERPDVPKVEFPNEALY
jgi:hypothetical protein